MPSSPSGSGPVWEPPSVEKLHELLPHYEIVELIGRGGMGAVYRGRQAKLDRPVAIKVLPEIHRSEDSVQRYAERFLLEAKSMASLDHPAIVSIYDFGETAEGHLYFVMEFIDGMDIQRYIDLCGGKVGEESAVAIISHVLDALGYAHERGIVHRDIKPANVLINREGVVKIADFGLAKKLGGLEETMALTATNMGMGTPDFIAPEAMVNAAGADGRADLYAVGVMLYKMLTGALPRGMFKMPSELVKDLDPRFDWVLARAMEPNPNLRYQEATEFRRGLDEIRKGTVSRLEGMSRFRGRFENGGADSSKREASRLVELDSKGMNSFWLMIVGIPLGLVLVGTTFWIYHDVDRETSNETGGLVDTDEVNVSPDSQSDLPESNRKEEVPKESETPSLKKEPSEVAAVPIAPPEMNKESDPLPVNELQEPSDSDLQELAALGTLKPGKLNFWSNVPNDPISDLRAAVSFDDFVQVYCFQGGWIALRSTGETFSSDSRHERKRVRRIVKGWDSSFGLIDFDGNLEAMVSEAAKPKGIVTAVEDAFVSEAHSIALLEDGSIQTWGPVYEGEYGDRVRWKRPEVDLEGIREVHGNLMLGAVLSNDGRVIAWRASGPCRMPPPLTKNVRDLACRTGEFRIVDYKGMMYWWRASDSGANRFTEMFEDHGAIAAVLPTENRNFVRTVSGVVSNGNSGPTPENKYTSLARAFRSVRGRHESQFSFYTSRSFDVVRFLWIEQEGPSDMKNPVSILAKEEPALFEVPDIGDLKKVVSDYQAARSDRFGSLFKSYGEKLQREMQEGTGRDHNLVELVESRNQLEELKKSLETQNERSLPSAFPNPPDIHAAKSRTVQFLRSKFDLTMKGIERDLGEQFQRYLSELERDLRARNAVADADAVSFFGHQIFDSLGLDFRNLEEGSAGRTSSPAVGSSPSP